MYTPLKFKPWKHKWLVTGFYKLNKEDKDEEHLCTGNKENKDIEHLCLGSRKWLQSNGESPSSSSSNWFQPVPQITSQASLII